MGGVCCCFDCDAAAAELCFAERANQSVSNEQCNVAPTRKRHSVCESASFIGGGECNASCVLPTPAPTAECLCSLISIELVNVVQRCLDDECHVITASVACTNNNAPGACDNSTFDAASRFRVIVDGASLDERAKSFEFTEAPMASCEGFSGSRVNCNLSVAAVGTHIFLHVEVALNSSFDGKMVTLQALKIVNDTRISQLCTGAVDREVVPLGTCTPPPTPAPPLPPGSCCCSLCTTNRCIEDVDDEAACQAACGDPPLIAGGAALQSCISTFASGETCASSRCDQPVDCCPEDPFVIAGSDYASAQPTMCGTFDYNCDGRVDQFPCCYSDKPAPNAVDARTVYLVSMCQASGGLPLSQNASEVCGACAGQTVVPGWECTLEHKRKRFVSPCPGQCEPSQPQLVTPETPPSTGQCALFVDRCIGTSGGDGETCCQVVVQ